MSEQPFEPIDEQEYSVAYQEGANVRTLIGTIEFCPDGSVIVHRTRSDTVKWIWLPNPIKIERLD
jgi:hypothetical protein